MQTKACCTLLILAGVALPPLEGTCPSNAGGINVIRHGMMRNVTLGLEVVLADGTVLSSMNQNDQKQIPVMT